MTELISTGPSHANDGTARAEYKNPARAAALQCAGAGFSVFPIYGVVNGVCSCGAAHGPGARYPLNSIGKHPRNSNGVKGATPSASAIAAYFDYSPHLNYGIATGIEINNSGKMLVVVDVDVGEGKVGDATLRALESRYGKLPDTATVITGSGGMHYYFMVKVGTLLKPCLGENIDLKCAGGYVVGPGSMHRSGWRYEWEGSSDPFEGQEIADLPDWVIEVAGRTENPSTSSSKMRAVDSESSLTDLEVRLIELDLRLLSADVSRADWLEILMALHSRSQSEQMFQIVDNWSKSAPNKYNANNLRSIWTNLDPHGAVTFDTFRKRARIESIKGVDISKLLKKLKSSE
jgi:hypothetical protein